MLSKLGYPQYEISNFALKGYESRHNLHYWHDEEYLGIGPSAHSFLDGQRFYYDNDFQHFYDNEICEESAGGDSEEYIMLALRLTEGLVFDQYKARFGKEVSQRLIKAAERLEQQGLCNVTDDNVSLTVKGFLVSNAVIAYLLENT
jgi:oxygen-independent coproporphyrinogen-3 oxidase